MYWSAETEEWARGFGRALIRNLTVFAFFLALAGLATRPLVGDLRGQTLASPDPLIDLWTINWLTTHFFDPQRMLAGNIFHPAPHAVLYSDLSLGTVLLVLPLRAWLRDPVLLYNGALLLTLAFAGWAWYRLAHELTGCLWGSLMAGIVAAFSSHQLFHIYHLNLVGTGWLALFVLGLHRLRTRPSWRAAVLAGLSFAVTAQSSGYYAVAATVLALVLAGLELARWRERRLVVAVAGAVALATLLTLPYLMAYARVDAAEGLRRPLGLSARMAFQPGRDLGSQGYLYGALLGGEGERLFPGLLCLGLAGLALVRRAGPWRFYAAAIGVLLVLSLGPSWTVGGHTVALPYYWLATLPLLDGMRHPYTFAAVATFLLAVVAALGWREWRWAARPWAGPLLVALAVAEVAAPGPKLRPLPAGLPGYFEVLDRLPPGPVLEVPPFAEETLLWAARTGRPMLNGQGSAFAPLDALRLNRYVENQWLRGVPSDLDATRPARFLVERTDVRYVVVPAGRKPQFIPLLGAFSGSRLFRQVASSREGDVVFEVVRQGSQSTVDRPDAVIADRRQ
ncbi:MAG TPA: hypothetical protein VF310_05150 [Vicinamibacteria bacterium]